MCNLLLFCNHLNTGGQMFSKRQKQQKNSYKQLWLNCVCASNRNNLLAKNSSTFKEKMSVDGEKKLSAMTAIN